MSRNYLNKNARCELLSLLFLVFTLAVPVQIIAAQQDSNIWHIGKGLQPETYLKYKVQDSKVREGPYDLLIYFKEQTPGGISVAEVFVIPTDGKLVNGTFFLDDRALNVYEDSPIPAKMNVYKESYVRTIQWPGSSFFAAKPGQSLEASQWQSANSLGGETLKRIGIQNTTTAAGVFLTHHFEINSQFQNVSVWINRDLPYPVKGGYSDIESTNNYELIEIGTEYPPAIPEFSAMYVSVILGATVGLVIIWRTRFFGSLTRY